MLVSLLRPVTGGTVSQWFGENPVAYAKFKLAGHNGVDYAIPVGTSVVASHAGTIVTGVDDSGYGVYVKVVGLKFETIYGHLSKVLVKNGDDILAGQPIGLSGNTGNSTGPHLHFGLRIYAMRNQAYFGWIDPVPFRDI